MRRLILAVSGASGMPLAFTLAQVIAALPETELHLMVSPSALRVLAVEGGMTDAVGFGRAEHDAPPLARLRGCATREYDAADMGAAPASGSWRHDGMIVCPCSMATLAAVASGAGTHLLHRAADVCLKERFPLVLVPRETPLSRVHLRNMLTAQESGAVIMPFCPAFYGGASTIDDLLTHMAGRILDQLRIPHTLGHRWQGVQR